MLRFTSFTPPSEHAEAFRAYCNYLVDLDSVIAGNFGVGPSMIEGVHDGVLQHPPVRRIQRKKPDERHVDVLGSSLRKAWSNVHRLAVEVHDRSTFDAEANAWLPAQAYYAIFHAILAYASASHQRQPRDHRAALNFAGEQVARRLMPFPWSACCTGGPDTADIVHGGLSGPVSVVSALSSPDPATAEARLAMFLRTTRLKELDRRYAAERGKKPAPGRTRRNVPRARKVRMAQSLGPTTIFDIFWRLRKKAHYDDADVFVLGAGDDRDGWSFGASLATIADATVAALEALMIAHVGPEPIWRLASEYKIMRRAHEGSAIALRVDSLARQLAS